MPVRLLQALTSRAIIAFVFIPIALVPTSSYSIMMNISADSFDGLLRRLVAQKKTLCAIILTSGAFLVCAIRLRAEHLRACQRCVCNQPRHHLSLGQTSSFPRPNIIICLVRGSYHQNYQWCVPCVCLKYVVSLGKEACHAEMRLLSCQISSYSN